MARQIRSFACGLGLTFGSILASFVAAGTQTLPARLVPALVVGGAMALLAFLSRAGLGVRSASLGSLLTGCAVGSAAAIAWVLAEAPLLWGCAGGLVGALAVALGQGRAQPRRVPAHRPLLATLVVTIASLAAVWRWTGAQPYLGPPWYGPCVAACAALSALTAGTLLGGWLRRRIGNHYYPLLRTPVVLVGIGTIVVLALPPSAEATRALAIQIQDKSISFSSFLLGVGLLDLRIIGPVTLTCGVILGFLYHAGRGHPHHLPTVFVPLVVATVVLASPPGRVLRMLEPKGRFFPWTGLPAPTTAFWPPRGDAWVHQVADLVSLMAPHHDDPLLIVGWWGPDLAGELREKGHELTVEAIGGAPLGERLVEIGPAPLFRAVVFGPPSRHRSIGTPPLSSGLLRRMKRQLKPGGHMIVVEHLGRIRTRGIATLLGDLRDVMGSAQAWIAGEHLLAVGGPPAHERRTLEEVTHLAKGPLPLLILDSSTAARFIESCGRPRHPFLFLELPRWQRRLQPWDPFLAARNIKALLGASDWPAGPFPGHRDAMDQRLLAGRYILSITAARLEMDEQREQRLLSLARDLYPDRPDLDLLIRTHTAHYTELGKRARAALQSDRTDAAAHFTAGRLALAHGSWRKAKEHITGGALKWRKNLVDAYPFAADILEEGGHLDWALALVEENGFPYAGRQPDVLEVSVRALGAAGDLEGAARSLEELGKLDPCRPGLDRLRGHLALLRHDVQTATRHLTLALREDPFDPRIYRDLAGALVTLGRDREADRARLLAARLEGR